MYSMCKACKALGTQVERPHVCGSHRCWTAGNCILTYSMAKNKGGPSKVSSATELRSNIKGATKTAFKTSSALGRACLTEHFPGGSMTWLRARTSGHPMKNT